MSAGNNKRKFSINLQSLKAKYAASVATAVSSETPFIPFKPRRKHAQIVADVERYYAALEKDPGLTQATYAKQINISRVKLWHDLNNVKYNQRYVPPEIIADEPPTLECTCNGRGSVLCEACMVEINEQSTCRLNQRWVNLNNELNQAIGAPAFNSPVPVSINLAKALDVNKKYWGEIDLSMVDGFQRMNGPLSGDIKFNLTKVESRETSYAARDRISYASARESFDMPQDRLVKAQEDAPALHFWEVEGVGGKKMWNHATIATVCHNPESIAAIAKQETKIMSKSPTYRRGGAAAGAVEAQSPENFGLSSKSHSKQTKEDRCHQHNSKCPVPKTKWVGTDGKVKTRRLNNDIRGTQTRPAALRQLLMRCKHRRQQAITIQQSRFTHQLVVCTHELGGLGADGFPPKLDNGRPHGIWCQMTEAMIKCFGQTCNSKNSKTVLDEWFAVDCTLTEWDIVLLEYYLMTGELINDQAVAAHVDTSAGHIIETMDLIAKLRGKLRGIKEIVKHSSQQVGYLMLPFQDLGLLLRPGLDVLHADLTFTVHLAEKSRGRTNLSRVSHTPA
jgi:hypothetical protein